MDPRVVARFWANIDKNGPVPAHRPELGPCWMWLGGRSNGSRPWEHRYGNITVSKKHHNTHRVSWEIANGEIPERLCVLHECDNPPCCNPSHLKLGPQVRNRRDAAIRGRTFGKLNELDALEIHILAARGETQRNIAARFKVARNTVVCVLRGVTFHHVFAAVSQWCTAPREESEAA